MLHVEDARAGREFLRRLTPHVDSAADWWQAGEPWIAVAITYSGLVALGVPEDSLQSFPEAFRVGMAARADELLDDGANDPKHWDPPFGTGRDPHRGQRLQRLRGDVAPHDGHRRGSTTRAPRPDGADDAGLRRPAGRPQPAGLQGLDRPARHRGQRRRAAARPGTGRSRPASSSSATRARPACRCRRRGRTCWDATAPSSACASTSRGSATFNRFLQAHAETEEERELLAAKLVGRWRSGAPLTLAPTQDDPALGADPLRNNDFTYADDPHGQQVPLGSHMRRMNPRDTEMAIARRRQPPPHHPAQHDLRRALRPGRDLRAGRRDRPRPVLHLHQRQGDGDAGVPAAGVDQQRQLHGPGRRARSERRAAGGRGDVHDPARARSGAASTASRRSTCCAAASTSSCRRCRR